MKKILLTVIAFAGICISSYAQTTPAKKATPSAEVKTSKAPGGAKAATTAAPVKSDGTPDMRYKANREAEKETPKLKKDGTPDMRYNRNKKQ